MSNATEWTWERPDTFGSRLRFLRGAFALSADAAGLACGFNGQSWRNWESGVHKCSGENIRQIVERFEGRPDQARVLAGWLVAGGPLPEQPKPPTPFAARSQRSKAGKRVTTSCYEHINAA
jgi:hypothetical protein